MPNTRKDISTIQVDKDVKRDLDKLIIRKGETYSQIIRRLIETHVAASKEMDKTVKEKAGRVGRRK